MRSLLGELILSVHLLVIGFNLAGLVVIPLGAKLGWGFVRIGWLRALHLAALAVVAVQAVFGRACFLTIWQADLTGDGRADPLIMRFVNGLIYWRLPIWIFTVAYLLVFAYVAALWWRVPPRRGRRSA